MAGMRQESVLWGALFWRFGGGDYTVFYQVLIGKKPSSMNPRSLWLRALDLRLHVWSCGIPIRVYMGA